MTARAPLVLVPALAALTAALSGCEGCAVEQRVSAQAPDGGPSIVVVPVPIPEPRGPDPEAPATCFVRAEDETDLVQSQITVLCAGAWTPGPVDCYLAARGRLRISDAQEVALCRCAESDAPVDCHDRLARETQLTDGEILTICAPETSLGLLPNCRPLGG